MMIPQLAISALAWTVEDEPAIYPVIVAEGIRWLELIPARIQSPTTLRSVLSDHGLFPLAFQALLYGTEGLHLFQSVRQREQLFSHLQQCCELAAQLGVRALVFGSPKNRFIENLELEEAHGIAIEFFLKLGDFAQKCQTTLCIEPNPGLYGCNFLTSTLETLAFVERVHHPAIRLNLDLGAVIIGQENLRDLWLKAAPLIGHIHWSEPGLLPIGQAGSLEYSDLLFQLIQSTPEQSGYTPIVSLEMLPALGTLAKPHVQKVIRYAFQEMTHALHRGSHAR